MKYLRKNTKQQRRQNKSAKKRADKSKDALNKRKKETINGNATREAKKAATCFPPQYTTKSSASGTN